MSIFFTGMTLVGLCDWNLCHFLPRNYSCFTTGLNSDYSWRLDCFEPVIASFRFATGSTAWETRLDCDQEAGSQLLSDSGFDQFDCACGRLFWHLWRIWPVLCRGSWLFPKGLDLPQSFYLFSLRTRTPRMFSIWIACAIETTCSVYRSSIPDFSHSDSWRSPSRSQLPRIAASVAKICCTRGDPSANRMADSPDLSGPSRTDRWATSNLKLRLVGDLSYLNMARGSESQVSWAICWWRRKI